MRTLNAYIEGDKIRKSEQDAFDYRQGQYFLSALNTALDSAFNGKKAQSKYVEKPFLSDLVKTSVQEGVRTLTEEEKQRQIDIFVMKRKIGKHNYDLAKELEGK